jgi:hypothetical protein
LEDYVEVAGAGTGAIRKFVIPRDEAMAAMADLDAMGISHATLFPEIEGAVRGAVWRTALALALE